jgi:hypothetical protein
VTRIPLQLLRTSERSTYKRCPWKWYQGTVRGLQPINPRQDARWFGTGIHLCKAEWYIPGRKRGRNMHDTWEEYAKDSFATMQTQGLVDDEYQKVWVESSELAHAMIDGHLKTYGEDDNWEVIGAEYPFKVRIPHPTVSNRAIVMYAGTIDLIIKDLDTGYVWLDDTKTAARIYTHHLTLLEQPAAYVAVGTHVLRADGKIGPKERIRGIIFDFMRKALPDERPRNERGEATNKPIKKHYIASILGVPVEKLTEPGALDELQNAQAVSLQKKKLEDLQFLTKDTTVLGDVSKDQGSPLFLREEVVKTPAECRRQIQRIGEEALHMRMARAGKIPILKTPQDDCSFCDYFDLCELDESGGDTEYFEKSAFKVMDPYADHRPKAVNSKTSVRNKVQTGVR